MNFLDYFTPIGVNFESSVKYNYFISKKLMVKTYILKEIVKVLFQ